MKISKLLSKKNFSIIFVILIGFNSYAEDKPVDIWNLDKEQIEENISTTNNSTDNKIKDEIVINETSIYKSQNKKNKDEIRLDQNLTSSRVKIIGLYDPEDYGLDIDMWLNSDGHQLKNLISKLIKIKLSDDASEIVNISMLTNAYYPKKNISNEEFLKFKSDWLIKNSNLDLIEKFLVNN